MATTQYVRLKFKATALASLITWGIVLFLLLVWACLDLSPLNRHESFVRAVWNDATSKQIFGAVLCALAVLLLIMRAAIIGCWLALIGRKSFVNAMSIGLPPLNILFLTGTADLVYHYPALRDVFIQFAPWIAAILLLAKLCIALFIAGRLQQLGLITMRQAAITLLTWAVATACICLVLFFYDVPLTLVVLCGVALLMPLARIAAAPLALHYNRHR